MSLLRQALKRAADETESPSPSGIDERAAQKKGGGISSRHIGFVIILLIILGVVLVFSFFPNYLPFPKRITSASRPTVKQIELKPPTIPTTQEKVQIRTKVSEKPMVNVTPSPGEQVKKSPPPGSAKPPASLSDKTAGTYFSPEPRPRPVHGSHRPSPSTNKTQARGEKKPTPETPAAREETDALQVVRLFNEAVQNQQKGYFPLAIKDYQELLSRRPNHWETYNNLGLIYQEQKRYPQALDAFQKALYLNPRYIKGINNLGLYYLKLGKLEEAGNQFRKALDLDPNFLPALINLSVVLKKQGQVEQARKKLLKVLDYDPENVEAQYNLGLLWEEQGVESKALEHYRKFIAKAKGPYSALAEELKKRWPELK